MRSRARICGLLTLLGLAMTTSAAHAAEFGIVPGSLSMRTLDAAGLPDNSAGAHPDRMLIQFSLAAQGTGTAGKDFIVELPPGFGGNPSAVPTCPRIRYETEVCPEDTLVGIYRLNSQPGENFEETSIFNIEPAPNQLAEFGSVTALVFNTPFAVRLRPDDYGLTLGFQAPQVPSAETGIELWGIPADHQKSTEEEPVAPREPFLTTPTRCGPEALTLRLRSWEPNAPWLTATTQAAPLEGCQNLAFSPDLGFALTNPAADAPTGMQANLSFAEHNDPDGLVDSQVENVSIRLPEGMSVSPAGAEGLSACSDAQFGLGVEGKPTCPFASKVGSVVIESPQSRQPLSGSVYLGQERPGERFRLFVTASAPGIDVKLTGPLRADPESGRLTASLNDLPQLPLSRIDLSLDGGPRGLLATPIGCGATTARASFDPRSGGAQVVSSVPVAIGPSTAGAACSSPFSPELVAGSTNRIAGHATSFAMTLHRADGEQLPERFSVELPSGLSPALGTIDPCGASAAAAGTCPAASRIGSAVGEIGSGPNPAGIEGTAYLTGPYRHAPFGLALVFAAKIGPFDLGNLVVRGKVSVDPLSSRATIETDSLPEVFEGIQLRFQTLGLDLDRKGFLSNPTSCEPTSVDASIRAQGGGSVSSQTPFSLRGCNRLRFQPTFSMALTGSSQLHRHGRPNLLLSTRLPRGNANLRSFDVLLPKLLQVDVSNLKELCARRDALAGRCPPGSRIGTSFARTPLSHEELKGPVYVVQPKGSGPPDLWARVNGLGVHQSFRAATSARDQRTRVTLVDLPDMPLSTFTMRLDGGAGGVVSLRGGLCAGGHLRSVTAPFAAEAQQGSFRRTQVPLNAKADCKSAGRRPARHLSS
jgi:hypothetical protein